MDFFQKILKLRKQRGLSQEELAEKMNVSRQTVSRWELGSAQPDASNLLQLSRLFAVSSDYLINSEYEDDSEIPAAKKAELTGKKKTKQVIGAVIALFGLAGNFILYLLSRTVKVMVPFITYDEAGKKLYNWSGDHLGYSYPYFLQEHHLVFLTILFCALILLGLALAFAGRKRKDA